MTENDFEAEQEREAAAEAGAIGGRVSSEPPTDAEREMSEAERPLSEAGEGESEGFELAELELQEHASHGDEHSAGRIIEDAAQFDGGESSAVEARTAPSGEGDEEGSPDA